MLYSQNLSPNIFNNSSMSFNRHKLCVCAHTHTHTSQFWFSFSYHLATRFIQGVLWTISFYLLLKIYFNVQLNFNFISSTWYRLNNFFKFCLFEKQKDRETSSIQWCVSQVITRTRAGQAERSRRNPPRSLTWITGPKHLDHRPLLSQAH